MKDYDCCNYCLSLGIKDCCPCYNKVEDIINDFVCDFYVPNYNKIVDENRAAERAKVIDEIINHAYESKSGFLTVRKEFLEQLRKGEQKNDKF